MSSHSINLKVSQAALKIRFLTPQTLLPRGNKFNLSNVNIRRKISNYRLPKIFHRIQHKSEEKGILIFCTIFLSRLTPPNVNPRHKRISNHFVSVQ